MSRLAAALQRALPGTEAAAQVPAAHPVDHLPPGTSGEDAVLHPDTPLTDDEPPQRATAARTSVVDTQAIGAETIAQAVEAPLAFGARYVDKVVISPDTPPVVKETYRRLAATLHHAQGETGLKTLLVASAAPEEGKTLTATNIALTFSESYRRRVLLIDADLRRPSVHDVFQLPNVFGLNEALSTDTTQRVSVIAVSPYLSVLTSGAPEPDPMSKLTSDRMKRLLTEAAAGFDWVIIDTPPVGIMTDAKLLAEMVDGTIFVVGAGQTSAQMVQRAVESIGRNRIVGVVLNRADATPAGASESYYAAEYAKPRVRARSDT